MKQFLFAYSCLLSACIPGRLSEPEDVARAPKAIFIPASWQDFNRIPETGSVFSIQLLVQLAVRRHPHLIFNPFSGSVGHVFLAMKKVNAGDSVVRYFGFYPKSGFPGIFNKKPVESVLADKSDHHYDASLQIILSAKEFYCLLDQAQILVRNNFYQTYRYNCVDFALQLINEVRGLYPLKISLRKHSLLPVSCHTPEDLFQLIKNKK